MKNYTYFGRTLMGVDVSDIIKVTVNVGAKGLGYTNFGSAVVFANASDLLASAIEPDKYKTYTKIEDVAVDFATSSETYKLCEIWLGGFPALQSVKVFVRNSSDASWADTLNKARDQFWWYWTLVSKDVLETTADVLAIAKWCEAQGSYFPNSQTGTNAEQIMDESVDNDVASELTKLGLNHVFTSAHKTDAYSAVYAAKLLAAVNYSAENSAITVEGKTSSGLASMEVKGSEVTAMKTKNVAYYTTVTAGDSVDVGVWLNTKTHSSLKRFMDSVIDMDALKNRLEVDLYNVIRGTTTKIPQTTVGQASLIDATRAVFNRFVLNGVLGARKWTNPNTNIEQDTPGYVILTEPEDIEDLSDADRAERKAAPINAVVLPSGAVHTVDISVTVKE